MGRGIRPHPSTLGGPTVTISIVLIGVGLFALCFFGLAQISKDMAEQAEAPSTAYAENGIFYSSSGIAIAMEKIVAFDEHGNVQLEGQFFAMDIPSKDAPVLAEAMKDYRRATK